jgi:hypothetical protein
MEGALCDASAPTQHQSKAKQDEVATAVIEIAEP